MLEQKQKSKQFQKVLDNFPDSVARGITNIQEFAFNQYKEKGEVPSFNVFFTVEEGKLVIFAANSSKRLPIQVSENPKQMDNLLKGFKSFLEKLGHDIMGFISIQQVWTKKVYFEDEEIPDIKESIKDAIDKKDCLMFLIDTPDNSLTLIYEKIIAGEDYVISPEPIEELYVDKKDPNSPVTFEKSLFNFF